MQRGKYYGDGRLLVAAGIAVVLAIVGSWPSHHCDRRPASAPPRTEELDVLTATIRDVFSGRRRG